MIAFPDKRVKLRTYTSKAVYVDLYAYLTVLIQAWYESNFAKFDSLNHKSIPWFDQKTCHVLVLSNLTEMREV